MENHSTLSPRSFQNFPTIQPPGAMAGTVYSNQGNIIFISQSSVRVQRSAQIHTLLALHCGLVNVKLQKTSLFSTCRSFDNCNKHPISLRVENSDCVWMMESLCRCLLCAALALWNEQRCAWVGTQPRPPPPREPREPAIRFTIFTLQ